MTSRRIVSNEKNLLEKDDSNDRTPGASEKSDIAPAVPAAVIVKLLGFTAAMVGGPIGVYFMTLNTIFRGSSTWAGAAAAITANVVLIAYVIVAMKEDQSDKIAAEENAKKKR
ncbi:MAG: hypothetical protein L6R40_001292 [Gallowayella cf. fulva]|nr:MAG: hypothetical protein L6R40_001292 [Xanthomendoza cf. fulva]